MAKSQSFKCGNEQSNGNYEMCNDFKQSLKLIEKHKLGRSELMSLQKDNSFGIYTIV